MRKCAVMQPCYLPWLGYFNLILNADVFIFLDDVQFSKNTYFNRNRIPAKNEDGFQWLTVPVMHSRLGQLFTETFLQDKNNWRRKHLMSLQHAYGKSQCFTEFFPVLESEISNLTHKTLADLNVATTVAICRYLGIEKNFLRSSALGVAGERSERLLQFCRLNGCEVYLSPGGAKDYIEEDGVLPLSDVRVVYQSYNCRPYSQPELKEFTPYMAVVDLLFREQPAAAKKLIFQLIE